MMKALTNAVLAGLASLLAAPAAIAQGPADAAAPCPFAMRGPAQAGVPDVVLIPGLGSSPAVWEPLVQQLEPEARVHLVHVAGFAGRAPQGPPETLLQRTADEIIAQLDCAHAKDAVVIGHSLGGFLALTLARDHPGRVAQVVVVDALPFYPLIFDPAASADSMAARADALRVQLLALDADGFAAAQRSGVRALVREAQFHEQVVGWSLASDRASFAGAVHALMTQDLRGDLARIAAPATILIAANPYAPRSLVEPLYARAYAGLKGARLRVVEESYHFIMLDQPEVFAAEIRAALASRNDAGSEGGVTR